MSLRSRFVLAASLTALVALLGACKPKPKPSTLVVRVLRDLRSIYGSEVDRRILEFQGSNPRLPSGEPVVVSSDTGDYKDMLEKQTSSSQDADVILLDAPEDAQASSALELALPQAANICNGVKACPANVPAIIPPQITGNKRQAAQMFVDFLLKAPLQEESAPASTATPATTVPSGTTSGESTGSTATPSKP
ncbi:MAG TPA: hypothetical protein VMD98_12040 [Bryocella sp.]|nr:hypothetical protein [Bryocella sp.]